MVLSVFGDIDSVKVLNNVKSIFKNLDDEEIVLKSHREDPPRQPREKNANNG